MVGSPLKRQRKLGVRAEDGSVIVTLANGTHNFESAPSKTGWGSKYVDPRYSGGFF
jgi:hypothetical protein